MTADAIRLPAPPRSASRARPGAGAGRRLAGPAWVLLLLGKHRDPAVLAGMGLEIAASTGAVATQPAG